MQSDTKQTRTSRPSSQILQMIGAVTPYVIAVFLTFFFLLQWTVDRALVSIDDKFSSIDKQFDNLSDSLKERFVSLDVQVKDLDTNLEVVGDKVTTVASNMAVAENKTDTVENEVVEARQKVEEVSSELDQTSAKVDSLKTVLNLAFKDNSTIKVLLEDDRLSEALPEDFFSDEPSKGAALPITGRPMNTSGNRVSIATFCSQSDLDTNACYQRFLKRYEHFYGR